MWVNKQHGILPNQYHYFYEQGDTLIYPEHIADLLTIDKMYNIRIEREHNKKEAKKIAHDSNKKGNSDLGSNFYNRKYVYKQ